MKTRIFVTVRDRIESTKICIDSLIATTRGKAELYIYDNNSMKDLNSLMEYYGLLLSGGLINSLVMNSGNLKEVYWSKAYAWSQFLDECERDPGGYVCMVDNDVRFHPGWLECAQYVLEHETSIKRHIPVISPWNGPPKYDTIGRYVTDDEKVLHVEIRERVGSPCWFTTYQYMRNIPTPPCGLNSNI